MNGTEPKIEIFAPFGAAYEWMKTVLFRPFDLSRWLVIAFAAFIAGAWGNGFNFNFGDWKDGDFKYRWSTHGNNLTDGGIPAWLIALIIVGALALLAIIVAIMWVSSRGQFIFTDCVVKNRAAIAEPWREFRREGNSYFLFSLVFSFVGMLAVGILVLIAAIPFGFFSGNDPSFGAPVIATLIILGLIWLVLALFFALIFHFMVPVMYRRRCSAKDAFLDVLQLVLRNPGPFVLLVLFGIVLTIAVGIIGTVVMCMTCCIGGLPYISTVLLLPAHVWFRSFKLLFVRQFGDAYDVWATVGFPATPAAPPPPTPPTLPPPPPVAPA